ncbi:MAG: hypothetical protein AAB518_00095 [Patescibacteria group bacterium]
MKERLSILMQRIEERKKNGGVDLSTEEDLSLAVMNLVSLEEHFFFTGVKTKKPEYFDLLGEVRNMRKELLAKLVDKNEGETWCVSKHLLATTMRLMEVGTKLHAHGKGKEAIEMFERANKIFSLFWALRLKLIDVTGLREVAAAEAALVASTKKPWTIEDITNNLVDCCDEN